MDAIVSSQLSTARPAQAPRAVQRAQPETLIYSDFDDTFATRQPDLAALQESREALKDPQLVFGLSTARELEDFKKLAPLLKGFPLAFLGLNNGGQLYRNDQNLPAEEWIAKLKQSDQDSGWAGRVHEQIPNWDQGNSIPKVLLAEGFHLVAGAPPQRGYFENQAGQRVITFVGSPGFYTRGVDPETQQLGRQVAQAVARHYESQKIPLKSMEIPGNDEALLQQFVPAAINKTTLLEYCLTGYPSVKNIITAGDNLNDTHLLPDDYGGIPNHRILAGDRPALQGMMADKERVVRVGFGQLGLGLARSLAEIRPEAAEAPGQTLP